MPCRYRAFRPFFWAFTRHFAAPRHLPHPACLAWPRPRFWLTTFGVVTTRRWRDTYRLAAGCTAKPSRHLSGHSWASLPVRPHTASASHDLDRWSRGPQHCVFAHMPRAAAHCTTRRTRTPALPCCRRGRLCHRLPWQACRTLGGTYYWTLPPTIPFCKFRLHFFHHLLHISYPFPVPRH